MMKYSNLDLAVPVIAIHDEDLSYQCKPLSMWFEENRLAELHALAYHSWQHVSIRYTFLPRERI
jgi:hypothetical protein